MEYFLGGDLKNKSDFLKKGTFKWQNIAGFKDFSNFRRDLKAALPMSVTFSGFNQAALEALAGKGNTASRWSVAVSGVAGAEFRFQSLQRSEVWTATYLSTLGGQEVGASRREACLQLVIDPTSDGPEWRLTVPPSITGE